MTTYRADNNFDGRFEWRTEYRDGFQVASYANLDGNGADDVTCVYRAELPTHCEYLDPTGRFVQTREHYTNGWLTKFEYDMDGDERFESSVRFNERMQIIP